MQCLAVAGTRGGADQPELCAESPDDLLGTGVTHALEQRLGFGLLRLGQEEMEAIGGSSGHAIGLTRMLADDLADP